MEIKQEDLWTVVNLPACYIVTTNAFITKDRRVVMGRGAAKEAVARIPGIDYEAGEAVLKTGKADYGTLIVRSMHRSGKAGVGIFQVKHHWGDPADLRLIENSLHMLEEICKNNGHVRFRLNYPGIGNGKLKRVEVESVLRKFVIPNLTVCWKSAQG